MLEDTETEESGTTEAEGATNLLIESNGKIRNASTEISRYNCQQVSQRQKMKLMTHQVHPGPFKQKSVTNLTKGFKKMKKAFTQLQHLQ